MSFTKHDATRLYKKLRSLEPNVSGSLGTPPSGSAVGAVGDVTLAASPATTTDVLDARITSTTFMHLGPSNLYGSAELGAGNIYWTSPSDGIMRITHTASTKTRSFKYLLMFALALLLASAAGAQVIEEDGTPLEVTPALNFGPGILCTLGVDVIDCDVYGSGAGGDVMLASEWATIAGAYRVDEASWSNGAAKLDVDNDGVGESFCSVGLQTCYWDPNEDGTAELSLTPTQVGYFSGGLTPITMFSSGNLTAAGIITSTLDTRVQDGLRVGNGSSTTLANSVCVGRDAASDHLFQDTDCDYAAAVPVLTPETTPATTTNAEPFLADMLRRLTATATTTAVAGAGVEVAGLQLDLDWIGAYWIEYRLLTQSALATCGQSFGVNFTGTHTSLYCVREYPSDGAAAATGILDDVAATNTGQLLEHMASNVASTVTPLLGPSAGVATNDSTAFETIRCNLLTTGAGDLELWMASETGSTVRVMSNSMVRATPFP